MPSKNTVKIYVKNSYYHVYNRGVDKRIIFQGEQDYKVFLSYLKSYLSSPPSPQDIDNLKKTFTLQGQIFKGLPRQPKNYFNKIDLIAYCLMPNHFHLLIKQMKKNSMQGFMRSLLTKYSMYFNKEYDRVGRLFQGTYKAVLIKNDRYLLHLSRYIHLNPSEYTPDLKKAYSSYSEYLGIRKTTWIKPKLILKMIETDTIPEIKKINSYENFVEKYKTDSNILLGNTTLEENDL